MSLCIIVTVSLALTRDAKVSRPAWSRDQFFGLGLGLTVIGLGLGVGLMKYWSRVSYALVSWSQKNYLLFMAGERTGQHASQRRMASAHN